MKIVNKKDFRMKTCEQIVRTAIEKFIKDHNIFKTENPNRKLISKIDDYDFHIDHDNWNTYKNTFNIAFSFLSEECNYAWSTSGDLSVSKLSQQLRDDIKDGLKSNGFTKIGFETTGSGEELVWADFR